MELSWYEDARKKDEKKEVRTYYSVCKYLDLFRGQSGGRFERDFSGCGKLSATRVSENSSI